jgi:hypothetical protein
MAHEVAQMRGSKCRQNREKQTQRAPVLRLEQHHITIIVPQTPVLRCYSDESRTPPKSPMCTPSRLVLDRRLQNKYKNTASALPTIFHIIPIPIEIPLKNAGIFCNKYRRKPNEISSRPSHRVKRGLIISVYQQTPIIDM